MRIVRTFGLVLFAAVALPSVGRAQAMSHAAPKAARNFDDSWFWGVKGGSTMFTTGDNGSAKVSAPTVGAEWLITRTRVALNLSIEQAFFDRNAVVFDNTAPGSARSVSISDLRRYNASLFVFPVRYGSLRPYAGLGLALNVIQSAEPQGTYSSSQAQQNVFNTVNEQSSRTSPVFTVGAQAEVYRASVFAQVATMPTRNNFLINGAANTFMLEAGVRFNLLSAIERLQ
ncbi:MAG: hypothetical protein ABIZ91_06960 [Gemmatimonadaceae bacterium]